VTGFVCGKCDSFLVEFPFPILCPWLLANIDPGPSPIGIDLEGLISPIFSI
jgi:hypothetical protein